MRILIIYLRNVNFFNIICFCEFFFLNLQQNKRVMKKEKFIAEAALHLCSNSNYNLQYSRNVVCRVVDDAEELANELERRHPNIFKRQTKKK